MYKYIDSDGSQIYFKKVDCSEMQQEHDLCYLAEDGSSNTFISIYDNDTDDFIRFMRTPNGIINYFDFEGRLYQITDSKSNKNIYINYINEFSEQISFITDDLGNRADFIYVSSLLDKIVIKRKDDNDNFVLEESIKYIYSGDNLEKIQHIPTEREYKKQFWNPEYSYVWKSTSIHETNYFTQSHSSFETLYGNFKTIYGPTTKEQYYKLAKHRYYDKIGFKIYKKNSEFWLSDVYLGTRYVWIDETPSLSDDADEFEKKYYYTTADLDPLKNEYYGNSFTYSGKTVYLNDRDGVSDDQYFVKYTDIYYDNTYHPYPSSTTPIEWTSSTYSDKQVGDYWNNYYTVNSSWTDVYGNSQYSSIRYMSTGYIYEKEFTAGWSDLLSGEPFYEPPKYSKSTPAGGDGYRWVLTGNIRDAAIESENIYQYDDENKLIDVKNTLDNGLIYDYNSNKQVNRIEQYSDNSSRKLISSMDITYDNKLTNFTDFRGNKIRYTFDVYGHTINLLDDFGNAIFYKYENIFATDTFDINTVNYNMNHKLIEKSLPQKNMLDDSLYDYIDTRTNLLLNPSLENSTDGVSINNWISNGASREANLSTDIYNEVLGNYSVKIDGDVSSIKSIKQEILQNGSAGDSFVFGGWAKAYATPYNDVQIDKQSEYYNPSKKFYIKITLHTAEDDQISLLQFNPNVDEWQYLLKGFTAKKDYTSLTFEVFYKNVNTALFDGLQLYKDKFGTTYEYNDKPFDDPTDPSGENVAYVEKSGTVKRVEYPTTGGLQYEYDPNDVYQVTEVTDDDGNVTTYVYDQDYKLKSVSQSNNVKTSFRYSSDNQVNSIITGIGSDVCEWFETKTSYTTKLFIDTITDEYGNSIDYNYDFVTGLLMSLIDQDNVKTEYEYDAYGRLVYVSKIDASNTYVYEDGLLKEINVNGFKYVFSYDEFGKAKKVYITDENDNLITDLMDYEYEEYKENLLGYLNDVYNDYTYWYNSQTEDRKLELQDALTVYYAETVDSPASWPIIRLKDEHRIDVDPEHKYFYYFEYMHEVEEDSLYFASYIKGYDENNQYTNISSHTIPYSIGSWNKHYYSFSTDSTCEEITPYTYTKTDGTQDKMLSYWHYRKPHIYDLTALGIEHLSDEEVYNYLKERIDNHENSVYHTNKLLSQKYSNGDYIEFEYNDEGQVTKIKFNNEVRFSYEYDHMGNVTKYNDLVENETYTYHYDMLGRIQTIADLSNNQVSYDYDDKGYLSEFAYSINGTTRTVTYHTEDTTDLYDKTTYNVDYGIDDGIKEVTKDYIYLLNDDLHRLDKISLSTGYQTLNQTFGYDDSSVVNGNASTRIKKISYNIGNGLDYSYTYDNRGNITKIEVKENSVLVEQYDYEYDDLNQLVREDIKTPSYLNAHVYEYDNHGNILHKKKYIYITDISQFDYVYKYESNGWNDQLTKFVGKTIAYDASGNPDSIGNDTLTWDGRQLVEYDVNGDGTNYIYKYNDQGIRTSKTVDGITTNYFLNGDKALYETNGTDVIHYTYDADGTLISMNLNGTEYFYVRNLQGDIVKLVDKDLDVVVEYEYDAWGNIVYKTNNDLAKINPYRYRGYRYDEETNWYYLNSRYYNPEWGRFINADDTSILTATQGEVLGHNLYAYCGNNPVMRYDPTGYLDWNSIGKGSGWLVVGISAVVIGVSVLTCGVATPLMVGIAVATIGAGALTTVNGISEIGEGFTDYNFMEDGVFQGNESAYNTYSTITSTTATVDSLICGGWMTLNKPRIQAYNNVGNYKFSDTLSDAQHMSRPFQSSTLAQREVIKYGNMVKEAPGRYKFMLNGWKLVVETTKEKIYHFGPF